MLQRRIGNAADFAGAQRVQGSLRLSRASADAPWTFNPGPQRVELFRGTARIRPYARVKPAVGVALRALKQARIEVTAKGLERARAHDRVSG